MKESQDTVLSIVSVEPVSGYTLKVHFNDGKQQTINFEPFLKNSRNPMIRQYLDPKKFAGFRLQHGDLVWDDYGLCFPILDLYENQI
ncbi:MAG TPA: DUF2442 domain-containing protein [Blastocatellia bacterium]